LNFEPTPILDSLKGKYTFIDNEMLDAVHKLDLFTILSRNGVRKRSGHGVPALILALLIWPFLGVDSIASFCGRMVEHFLPGGKAALYRFLRRQDINWRTIVLGAARGIFDRHTLASGRESAFVVDDTLKHRRGKKVEGVSSHFDHVEGRHVMGQQVLQLGLACSKGFLPLLQQIYIGTKKIQPLQNEFTDKRSAVAKDYQVALQKDKNTMLRDMLHRAVRKGIRAVHLLGDTWFGNKGNIRTAIDLGLVAIFMMKRGNLTYRFQGRNYTAAMLYELVKRRMKAASKGCRFMTFSLVVEINLAEPNEPEQWVPVRLLFSKPHRENKGAWVVLLCTDTCYSDGRILEIYSLRWSIEVYFKETKQAMGWMAEQSGDYAVHYASIHLAALRYMLLFNLALDNGGIRFGQVRDRITRNLQDIGFAALLWEFFRALLHGVMDHFKKIIGAEAVESILKAMDATVEEFLFRVFHIDPDSIGQLQKAEKMGAI
jgi:hypothetical protein